MAVTLKIDKRGLEIIDRARVRRGWTALALAWCEEANVSLSTLKRFRERRAIQKDSFISICQAVGVQDWQRVVAVSESDMSVVRRHYRQSKRVIAEEVLSNLDSLDARLDFVEQAFSNDPVEAQRQIELIRQKDGVGLDSCAGCLHRSPRQAEQKSFSSKRRTSYLDQSELAGKRALEGDVHSRFGQGCLKLEANVSIIQIMMEI